jgi:hypothetical protein
MLDVLMKEFLNNKGGMLKENASHFLIIAVVMFRTAARVSILHVVVIIVMIIISARRAWAPRHRPRTRAGT